MRKGVDKPTIELPIDGILDLHTFSPSEVPEVVAEYLAVCSEQGLTDVRIIHGKGQGVLRRTVESVLRRSPLVARFCPANESDGGWGATLVELRLPD